MNDNDPLHSGKRRRRTPWNKGKLVGQSCHLLAAHTKPLRRAVSKGLAYRAHFLATRLADARQIQLIDRGSGLSHSPRLEHPDALRFRQMRKAYSRRGSKEKITPQWVGSDIAADFLIERHSFASI